jgi:hypothetical protein
MGLIRGLEAAIELSVPSLKIQGDSKLVLFQVFGKWIARAQHLLPLQEQAKALAAKLPHYEWEHIPRELNGHADRLANAAIDAELGALRVRSQSAPTDAADSSESESSPDPSPVKRPASAVQVGPVVEGPARTIDPLALADLLAIKREEAKRRRLGLESTPPAASPSASVPIKAEKHDAHVEVPCIKPDPCPPPPPVASNTDDFSDLLDADLISSQTEPQQQPQATRTQLTALAAPRHTGPVKAATCATQTDIKPCVGVQTDGAGPTSIRFCMFCGERLLLVRQQYCHGCGHSLSVLP